MRKMYVRAKSGDRVAGHDMLSRGDGHFGIRKRQGDLNPFQKNEREDVNFENEEASYSNNLVRRMKGCCANGPFQA